MKSEGHIPASFRDPSGYLFRREGVLYRRISKFYEEHYRHLIDSGLYQKLVDTRLLIPHEEVNLAEEHTADTYKIIRPEIIPFISYPYEWCFSQLKDAARTTLTIQQIALDFGMSLKDSSAYNIQFRNGAPLLIDTLSFEKYPEGQPWIAYRQFCQHFLAPLALMSYNDVRLSQLLRIHIDGIPLDLAASLLPIRTLLRFGLLSHIHLHAKSQRRYAGKPIEASKLRKISRSGLLAIISSLESSVDRLKWIARGTEWGDYYEDTNYSPEALEQKQAYVGEFLKEAKPHTVWDMGANTGLFSRVAGTMGIRTISFDVDPAAVEKNYLECVKNKETAILPLVMDLTNPSPGIGWENQERSSLLERSAPDAILALALIHHLAISNNLPLGKIASFFGSICDWLIIEFVPKSDSQVQRLLISREDIFPDYTQESFEAECGKIFEIRDTRTISGSERVLYLMKRL